MTYLLLNGKQQIINQSIISAMREDVSKTNMKLKIKKINDKNQ